MDVRRRRGVSEQTFCRWKGNYGGLRPSEAHCLKTLEDENRRLKKLLAEAMLDVSALKGLQGKTELACGAAGGCASPGGRAWLLAAARLQAGHS